MNEKLGNRFAAFVAKQPPDRRINHCSWDTCAVGEFTRECKLHTDEPCYMSNDLRDPNCWVRPVVERLGWGDTPQLGGLNTYSELHEALVSLRSA